MPHPCLQCFDGNPGFVAHGAVGDPEIMASDIDRLPGRKILVFLDQLFVLLCLAVPTAIAAIDC